MAPGRFEGGSHAIRSAQEGADIIAVDVARDIQSVTPFDRGAPSERWFA
jgi:hypothetical protein